MRVAVFLGLLVGIAILTGVVLYYDAGRVLELLATAGAGLLLVCVVHLVAVFANANAWHALVGGLGFRQSRWALFWMRQVADSINALLPVAQIGGEVVRGRMLMRAGVPGAEAGALVIADLTLGLVSLVLFILGGVVLMAHLATDDIAGPAIAGLAAFAGMLGAFYGLQRAGVLLRLAHLLEGHTDGSLWRKVAGGAAALDQALGQVYRQRAAVLHCILWRLGGWIGGALEIWVAFAVLGYPIGLLEALALESLIQVVRNAGFAIPGALGLQEGGFVVIGAWLGIPAEVALAVGLTKRIRDILLGVPTLLAWQVQEGRIALGRRPAPQPAPAAEVVSGS